MVLRPTFWIALLATLLLHVSVASAGEHPKPMSLTADRHVESQRANVRERPNVLGLKTGRMLVFEPHLSAPISATVAGLFYERALVEHWLEIEVSVPVGLARIDGHQHVFLPLDLHIKKPFHPTPWLTPYVGAGPAVDVFIEPEAKVLFGGSFALGTYVWPRDHRLGVDLELDYNVLAVEGAPAHEFLVALGPAWRI